ncbi:MAG TPA: aldo/keto reductase, partial [Verrucomicrobiae bacterium]|nr:aldo/keto reductase [Verrucomicrobiae bacterium]
INKNFRYKGLIWLAINFGKTGLKLSPIGFGGIPIQRTTENEAVAMVKRAVELGVDFFDSARGYTDSERKIGLGLKGGLRDKVVLATKTMARTKQEMTAEIETSLREFGTDYIDLYQCHNVRSEAEMETLISPEGGLEALLAAQQAGKIRFIGLTGHKPEVLVKLLRQFPFVSIQFPYNYIEQQNKAELIELAQELELGTIIMKPLAGGAISNGDLALRFLLEKNLGVIIPGMDTMEQVEKNLALAREFKPLSERELAALAEEVKGLGDDFCRRCEYCLPCPAGINIPVMFMLDSYYTRYGLPQWARDRYAVTPVVASACTKCGKCEQKCPYSLTIREKLVTVHEHLG